MRTVETRHTHGGYIVRRKVICPNGHRYPTVEIDANIWRSIERIALDRIGGFEDNARRFKRNEVIRKARKAGASLKSLGSVYGLTTSSVFDICQHNR